MGLTCSVVSLMESSLSKTISRSKVEEKETFLCKHLLGYILCVCTRQAYNLNTMCLFPYRHAKESGIQEGLMRKHRRVCRKRGSQMVKGTRWRSERRALRWWCRVWKAGSSAPGSASLLLRASLPRPLCSSAERTGRVVLGPNDVDWLWSYTRYNKYSNNNPRLCLPAMLLTLNQMF